MYIVNKYEGKYLVWIENSDSGWIFLDRVAAYAGRDALNANQWFNRSLEKPSQILFLKS